MNTYLTHIWDFLLVLIFPLEWCMIKMEWCMIIHIIRQENEPPLRRNGWMIRYWIWQPCSTLEFNALFRNHWQGTIVSVAQNCTVWRILETPKRKMGFTQRNGNLKSYSSGLRNCNWREWKRIACVSVHSLWVNHALNTAVVVVWSLMIANTQELRNDRSVFCSTLMKVCDTNIKKCTVATTVSVKILQLFYHVYS